MSVVEKFHRDFDEFSIEIKNWVLLDQGITVLWGPSGSGKTTILHGLLGLDPQAQVQWNFKGENLGIKSPAERNLGVVFQDFCLFPHMSVEKNILFPVDTKKHQYWKQDFDFLVQTLELEMILKSSVEKISGGEKQRVALARALIYRPQMLLLDEPFSALDESLRSRSRTLLKKVCLELQCPALLITHDREDLIELAHKVTHLEKGKIIKEETLKS